MKIVDNRVDKLRVVGDVARAGKVDRTATITKADAAVIFRVISRYIIVNDVIIPIIGRRDIGIQTSPFRAAGGGSALVLSDGVVD